MSLMHLSAVAGKASRSPRKWRRRKVVKKQLEKVNCSSLLMNFLQLVPDRTSVVYVTVCVSSDSMSTPPVCSVLLSHSHIVHSSSSFTKSQQSFLFSRLLSIHPTVCQITCQSAQLVALLLFLHKAPCGFHLSQSMVS